MAAPCRTNVWGLLPPHWGRGGTDTDGVPTPSVTRGLIRRVRLAGMKITRPPVSIGHYKMVKHKSDKGNEENPHRLGGQWGGWGRGGAGQRGARC